MAEQNDSQPPWSRAESVRRWIATLTPLALAATQLASLIWGR
jgi:hypothetical protein